MVSVVTRVTRIVRESIHCPRCGGSLVTSQDPEGEPGDQIVACIACGREVR